MDVKAVPPPAPVAPSTASAAPASSREGRPAPSNVLGPAVTFAIGDGAAPPSEATPTATAEQGVYTRDAESRTLVFQVLDPSNGDVVIQIPNAVVLRARAYEAAQGTPARSGATVQKQA